MSIDITYKNLELSSSEENDDVTITVDSPLKTYPVYISDKPIVYSVSYSNSTGILTILKKLVKIDLNGISYIDPPSS